MYKFTDDNQKEVQCVTAEAHALNNSGHVVEVLSSPSYKDNVRVGRSLFQRCTVCDWWDNSGIYTEEGK